MKRDFVTHCQVCGSNEKRELFRGQDLLAHDEGSFPVVACVACGFLYLSERPSLEALGKYYPEDYLSYQKAIEDEPSLLRRWERTYERHKRVRVIQRHMPGPGRILDIGCATGIFLDGMQKADWEVMGVEPSAFAVQYARSRFGINVFQGVLSEARFAENTFDVVTLWDVLEHIDTPLQTLEEIHRILKPGGLLVLGLPNPEAWERWLYGVYWPGWDVPRHFYLFRARHLRTVLSKLGMEWETCESFMGKHGTFVLALRFWLLKKKLPEGIKQFILFMARSIPARLITWPFYSISTHLNKSSYMTVFARKVR